MNVYTKPQKNHIGPFLYSYTFGAKIDRRLQIVFFFQLLFHHNFRWWVPSLVITVFWLERRQHPSHRTCSARVAHQRLLEWESYGHSILQNDENKAEDEYGSCGDLALNDSTSTFIGFSSTSFFTSILLSEPTGTMRHCSFLKPDSPYDTVLWSYLSTFWYRFTLMGLSHLSGTKDR